MSGDEIDRHSAEVAAEVMERWCPSKQQRKAVLTQLMRSVAAADGVSPQSWAVTLFNNGFRLNVGAVEALTFFDGYVSLFIHGSFPAEVQEHGEVFPCGLKSAPHPSQVFIGTPDALGVVAPLLASAHEAYVRGSAVTQNGKPRRTNFARYHSPGLYAYATTFVGTNSSAAV